MKPASDIGYLLELDGELVPLEGSITLGRHLDNDLLLAGEDVLEYHLRLEMTGRGLRAVPLGEASLQVNGHDYGEPVGLAPGDRLTVGQNLLTVTVRALEPAEAESWQLYRAGDGEGLPLGEACTVGRSADNDLQLPDQHVSRGHARLTTAAGAVWVCDLDSANGTFVNGERIRRACRLFHGDEVRFDTHTFQLIGRGGDLTPVNRVDPAVRPTPIREPIRERSAGSGATVELVALPEQAPTRTPPPPPAGEAGVFLLGASDPVAHLTFRAPMGLTVIGRHEDCHLVLRDPAVSGRHAEVRVRAEGVTLTDLITTNGTWVNGEQVQSARLRDGDVIRLGRSILVFRNVAVAGAQRRLTRARVTLLGVALVLAAGLLLLAW